MTNQKPNLADDYEKVYQKAVKFLAIRLHSTVELQRKLRIRGFNPNVIAAVLAKLTGQGLLNDETFARIYLDNLIKYKTLGFNGLKFRLIKRGIASNEAEELVRQNFPLDQEKQAAKKYLAGARSQDKKKLAYGLGSRGFRPQVIREVLGI